MPKITAPFTLSQSTAAAALGTAAPIEITRGSAKTAIGDPQLATVLGYDTAWPALPNASLTCAMITRAMQKVAHVLPATIGDGNRFAGRSIRQAAVLIALVQRDQGVCVLLTQRATSLRDHAGQIAFAGGATDAEDASAWHTAQREAWEEVGIKSSDMTFLGELPIYTTVTAFAVTPCVAWLDEHAARSMNTQEVAEVFEVPLDFLMNPANHQQRSVQTQVGERTFYAIAATDTLDKPRFIWGATAGMLRNLYRVLAFELN